MPHHHKPHSLISPPSYYILLLQSSPSTITRVHNPSWLLLHFLYLCNTAYYYFSVLLDFNLFQASWGCIYVCSSVSAWHWLPRPIIFPSLHLHPILLILTNTHWVQWLKTYSSKLSIWVLQIKKKLYFYNWI